MKARLHPEAVKAVREHAGTGYPNEVCGVLLGRLGEPLEIQEAHACSNLNAERAKDRYLINPQEQMAIEKDGRSRSLDVVGYYHSHPDHPAEASATDLDFSWEDLLYLIVSVQDARVVDRRAWKRAVGAKSFREVELEIVVGAGL